LIQISFEIGEGKFKVSPKFHLKDLEALLQAGKLFMIPVC